ncbi:MAG TPA: ChaN family lipoprotein [Burkholderiaceae bacterium]
MAARPRAARNRAPLAAAASTALAALLLSAGCAAPRFADFNAEALARQMAREPVVLLGEHHDNEAQHAVRAEALRRLLAGGARPAVAFEQFDRDRQPALDRARGEAAGGLRARADAVIGAAGGPGWNWDFYRPYVELALEYDLPIVAANLSRAGAMRVALGDFGALFDDRQRAALGLDDLPPALLREQERAVDEGHCHRMPADALPGLARAQIARDATLAQSIEPYAQRGVVLLTGNGHARRDIGVAHFLPPEQRGRTITIGLLETGDGLADEDGAFDAVFTTPAQPRADPCASIPETGRPHG